MKNNNRQNAGSVESVESLYGVDGRLLFPRELETSAERRTFRHLVNSYGPKQFNPGDVSLLINYIRMKALADKAYNRIKVEGEMVLNNKFEMVINPWLKIHRDTLVVMNSTAAKLRICPSSRVRPEDTKRSHQQAQSGKVFDPGSDWRGHQNQENKNQH